jgi:hypothetical protein
MFFALVVASIFSGLVTIVALGPHNPVLAVFCAPIVGSLATTAVALLGTLHRRAEH